MSSSSVASVWPSNDYAASEDIKEEGGREGERVRVEMRCAIKDKVRSKESRWEAKRELGRGAGSIAAKLDRIGPTSVASLHTAQGISCIVTSITRQRRRNRIFPHIP